MLRTMSVMLVMLSACTTTRRAVIPVAVPEDATPLAPQEPLTATLPSAAGRFAPGFAGVDNDGHIAGASLTDVESCAPCHAEAVAQWKTSAHSYASFNNPVYRVSVETVRTEAGHVASQHCGSCHDVGLLFDGMMAGEVQARDERAHFGVNCRTCHGVERATPDGNGSWTLADQPIPIPVRGEPESLAAHIDSVVKPPLRTAELCGTCHRTFLSEATGNDFHLPGADDLGAWRRSEFAGSEAARIDDVDESRCQDCHMPREEAPLGDVAADDEGRLASHRFLGGHSWLAAMRGDAHTLRRVRDFLVGAASIDLGGIIRQSGAQTLPADGAAIAPGEHVELAIVIRNQRVGHRFPGGTPDSQDTWIEVVVEDARGEVVAQAGVEQGATGVDPTAHRLRALLADENGQPVLERQANRFRAPVFNHTLGPREAAVVTYALTVPERLAEGALPLHVVARLLHRSRNLELQVASCAEHRSPRGRAFASAATRFRDEALDPCVAMPITEIARSESWLGEGAPASANDRPEWLRLYELGLGLLRGLQERVSEARPALEAALARTEQPRSRAMILVTLAEVAGRQGRVDESLDLAARAEALVGPHPAIDRVRGDALSGVWRFAEAAVAYGEASRRAPLDDTRWAAYAVAAGSASPPDESLMAAHRGLLLAPRDPDLLRAQALALAARGAPIAESAMEVYLAHRVRDDAPGVRAMCSRNVPGCALERVPVHSHSLQLLGSFANAR